MVFQYLVGCALEASIMLKWFRKDNAAGRKLFAENLEDIDALIRVRGICLAARAAAETTAADSENIESNRAFQIAKEKSIAVANGISNPFYRDTALHFIYVLCRRANDNDAAKGLLDRIDTYEIRGTILDGRPALFD
jgi:hypothetical protein